MNMTDELIVKIIEKQNPTCVGLDTDFAYLPEEMQKKCKTVKDVANAIIEFNGALINALSPLIPAVKVQVAYYEMLGVEGMRAFSETLKMAKEKGLVVISDVKRNDIGSTAGCYSKAFFDGVEIAGKRVVGFESDFITVNGYLADDGIIPFTDSIKKFNKGIFVLVKTSNPSSNRLQDLAFALTGKTLYQTMGQLVEEWGKESIGKFGFSAVGAVVGATKPEQAKILRQEMPRTFFLIPGYGAQGGGADNLTVCFNNDGLGGIVNNSRGIICAYKSEKYKGLDFVAAAKKATEFMKEDILLALSHAGKEMPVNFSK